MKADDGMQCNNILALSIPIKCDVHFQGFAYFGRHRLQLHAQAPCAAAAAPQRAVSTRMISKGGSRWLCITYPLHRVSGCHQGS